jgi:SAM-dependent methyltransferase/GNAT superfamily N-acetyltransferase
MTQLYDEIGVGYGRYRLPDPRIAAAITDALAAAAPVLNVGAGAGSYEPSDRAVIAVEPSLAMIRQRRKGSAPVVQASATHLPFRDAAFGAVLAVLTVHHWPDRARGLAELSRVARQRVVILTWAPAFAGFWLVDDYFPEIGVIDRPIFPSMDEFTRVLGSVESRPLLIPHDCTDGFLGAYWRRPHAYLDAGVRGAISTFSKIGDVEPGLSRLRRDLEDGTWQRRHGHLLDRQGIDLGYRLVIARGGGAMATAPERLHELPIADLDALVVESEQAGSTFVRRLVDEWVNGANRFDRPGEALFGLRIDGRLIGVCGLNVDPYTDAARVGRVRHLYVLQAFRRHGAGRRLVTEVIDASRGVFDLLRLSTSNPAAAQLYEAMGFRATAGSIEHATHVMNLTPAAGGRRLPGADRL